MGAGLARAGTQKLPVSFLTPPELLLETQPCCKAMWPPAFSCHDAPSSRFSPVCVSQGGGGASGRAGLGEEPAAQRAGAQPYRLLAPTDYPFLAAEGEVNHILTAPSLQHGDFSANQSLKTGSMKGAISHRCSSVWCQCPCPVPCDGFLCINAVPWAGGGPSGH